MWQLNVYTTDKDAAKIETQLQELSALAITMVNAGDEILIEQFLNQNPSWEHVKIEALFEQESQALLAQQILTPNPSSIEQLEDKNWVLYSLKDFKPIELANNFWIYPHWLLPEKPAKYHIVLDPGFAFGTGQHETTKMCLEALIEQSLDQKVVIDYGCGSGILALAALKLGAKKVYGVDIDYQALEASRQNARLNHIDDSLFDIQISDDHLKEPVDVIVANIIMSALLELRDLFSEKLKPNACLILSGLLKEQLPTVIEHYKNHFELIEQKVEHDWGCLIFKTVLSQKKL